MLGAITPSAAPSVTNDSSAFAVQPLRRFADVVYLPDFGEEFVAHGKGHRFDVTKQA